MADVHVTGVGMTKFGLQPDWSFRELLMAACRQAIADADVAISDIDAIYVGSAIAGPMTGQHMVAGQVALRELELDGVPIVNVENACASGATAFQLGYGAVGAGQYGTVLCAGVERMSHEDRTRPLTALAGAIDTEAVGDGGPIPAGRSVFMDIYARKARRMLEAGTATIQDFAAVVVKNRRHGALNELAQFGDVLTLEDVLRARTIVDPLTRPMCSPVSDGAAVAVLSGEYASPARSVEVLACELASPVATAGTSVVGLAARKAFERAGLGAPDADVIELHDATAPAELELYEEIGLCEPGGAGRLIREKSTYVGGRLAVNPSGGLLARGHPVGATGLAQIYELVAQIRGHAGSRQQPAAEVGVAVNAGGWVDGDNAAAAVTVLRGRS